MVFREKLYSVEEFLEIAALPENEDKQLELIDGEILEMAPSRPINSVVAMRIGSALFIFVDANDLGFVTGADGGFALAPRTVFIPDVGFISKARMPELVGSVFPIAPDLAVEVVSPSERDRQVWNKVRRYLQAGTKIVWAVYPDEKVVDVHRPTEDGGVVTHTLGIDDTLDGEDVLLGFKLPIKNIFPKES
jgi:Uma2 family endonuclease